MYPLIISSVPAFSQNGQVHFRKCKPYLRGVCNSSVFLYGALLAFWAKHFFPMWSSYKSRMFNILEDQQLNASSRS